MANEEHVADHLALYRHVVDPLAPTGEERRAIKERVFFCNYYDGGTGRGPACGWQPTDEQRAERERIDTEWLATKTELERVRLLKLRRSFARWM